MFTYPPSPRTEEDDVLHGVRVPDPYRWLEEIDSEQTRRWVEAQNEVTFGYLDRGAIRQRLTELWNYERYGVPFVRGGRIFFTRNDGLQNQSVLYWMGSQSDEPKLLLDPNLLSEDGTVALVGHAVSEDGKLLAYGLASSGSEWTEDGGGFYYSRYDEPEEGLAFKGTNYYHKLYYHRIGAPQAEDELVYERPDHKEWGLGGYVTQDGRYLIVYVWVGTNRENGIV